MQNKTVLFATDHAGFETQITFERKLAEEGKSRFDFDRQTLYQKIWEFVQANKGEIEIQNAVEEATLEEAFIWFLSREKKK